MKSKQTDFFILISLLGLFFGVFVLSLHIRFILNPIEKEIEIPEIVVDIKEEERIKKERELDVVPLEKRIFDQMSVQERVGQLFMFGIEGNDVLHPENKRFLEEVKPGAVLLFSKNISSKDQLQSLTNQISGTNGQIPPFIAVDQEGGVVSRIRWDRVHTEPQESIGNNQQAYEIAKSRGELLRELGVNMNLAPVVEYIQNRKSFIYNRTYRGVLEEVVQKSIFTISGYKNALVMPVIKHYPGHGDSSPDPHLVLPNVNISTEEWDRYIEPFSKIVGQIDIDAVMVGHILFSNIDSNPATLSSEIITKRLLEDQGYEGLVISDDMEMMALKDIGSKEEIAEKALQAGNDILIYSKYGEHQKGSQRSIYNHILEKVRSGEMDIDNKVLKILRMKIKYGILEERVIEN